MPSPSQPLHGLRLPRRREKERGTGLATLAVAISGFHLWLVHRAAEYCLCPGLTSSHSLESAERKSNFGELVQKCT